MGQFEEVGREVADSVGGLPVTVQLLDTKEDVEKTGTVGVVQLTGGDAVYYEGYSTLADAQALAQKLQAIGFFTGKGANVFLKKHTNGTTLAFVVTDGAWNDAKMVTDFETITRSVAPSIGGLPIDMRMMSTTLVVEKDETVTAQGVTAVQRPTRANAIGTKAERLGGDRSFHLDGMPRSPLWDLGTPAKNRSFTSMRLLTLAVATRSRGLAIVLVQAALGLHLLELLLLRVVQDGFDLGVGILHQGLDLGVAIPLAERGVRAKVLHLLEAIGKDGLDLRHLIVAQSQPLAQMRGLPVGVEVAVEVPPLASACGALAAGAWLVAGACANARPAESSAPRISVAFLALRVAFISLNSPCGCRGADRPLRV